MPVHYGPDRIEGPLLEVPNQAEYVAILTFCTTDFVVKFFMGPSFGRTQSGFGNKYLNLKSNLTCLEGLEVRSKLHKKVCGSKKKEWTRIVP